MSLVEQITSDLKEAMRAKDKMRLAAVRAIRGEILKLQKGDSGEADDETIIKKIKTLIKEKNETIEMAIKGDRPDMVEEETAQLTTLKTYLPAALSEQELKDLVLKAIANTGAEGPAQMGNVMKEIRGLVAASGKDADMKLMSQIVKGSLS